jgi:hypothetical protein
MTKRLFLSLAVITLALAGVAGATAAVFSSGAVLGDSANKNIFQTGSVQLGGFNVTNLNVTGLAPGVDVVVTNVGVNYIGDLNADIYIGATGTSSPGDAKYIADHCNLVIYNQGTSVVVWFGKVSDLSTVWTKIANNTTAGWKAYDLKFTLDTDTPNFHQGVTNSDTQILFYAVQTGGAHPSGFPYTMTGTNWFDL